LALRPPSIPTRFPYTTLFRSPAAPALVLVGRGGTDGDVPGLVIGAHLHVAADEQEPQLLGQRRQPVLVGDPAFQADLRFQGGTEDRKSTRLNSSHVKISYAVF